MNLFRSLLAWIAAPFRKVKIMSDTYDANGQLIQQAATADEQQAALFNAPAAAEAATPVVQEAQAAAPAPARDVIQVLEGILTALGHELPVFWAEAAALAKKVL